MQLALLLTLSGWVGCVGAKGLRRFASQPMIQIAIDPACEESSLLHSGLSSGSPLRRGIGCFALACLLGRRLATCMSFLLVLQALFCSCRPRFHAGEALTDCFCLWCRFGLGPRAGIFPVVVSQIRACHRSASAGENSEAKLRYACPLQDICMHSSLLA